MNAPGLFGFITMPGGSEWIIIGVVALLIFGRRLPEVARSLGKGIVEFKKGIADVESEVDRAGTDYGADTSTVDSSSETGTEDDYGAEHDYSSEGEYGADSPDEGGQDEYGYPDEDPVDEADTYETFDAPDEAAEDEDDTHKDYDSAEASADTEAVQEDPPSDDVDPGHRDDAHHND